MNSSPRFHRRRVQGRLIATQIAAAAQAARLAAEESACHDTAIARRWAPCSAQAVAKLFQPGSGKALTLGDTLALPLELAREILTRALVALDEQHGSIPSAEETVWDLTISLGEIAALIKHDRIRGKVNHRLHADHFARIAAIAMRGHLAAVRKAEAAEGVR